MGHIIALIILYTIIGWFIRYIFAQERHKDRWRAMSLDRRKKISIILGPGAYLDEMCDHPNSWISRGWVWISNDNFMDDLIYGKKDKDKDES